MKNNSPKLLKDKKAAYIWVNKTRLLRDKIFHSATSNIWEKMDAGVTFKVRTQLSNNIDYTDINMIDDNIKEQIFNDLNLKIKK